MNVALRPVNLWMALPLLAAGIVMLNLWFGWKVGPDPARPLDPVGVLLAGASVASLVLIRWRPGLGVATVVVLTLLYLEAGYPLQPGAAVIAPALFLGFVMGAPAVTGLLGALLAIRLATSGMADISDQSLRRLGGVVVLALPLLPIVAAAAFVSYRDRVRVRRRRAALEHEVAIADLSRDVEHQRVEIARELHDSIGHSLAVTSLQSGAALRHIDDDPDTAREALFVVNDACRRALQDTKRALDALRGEAEWVVPPVATTARTAQRCGLRTVYDCAGSVDELPLDVDVAMRRVAQEALTNTLRHSDATTVDISIEVNDGMVRFRFSDNGASTATGSGSGLAGMAHRVEELGGRFDAGPTAAGFVVRAWLPLQVAT